MIPLRHGPNRQAEASEPRELLASCHDKIRNFCGVALRLADGAAAPHEQIVEAASGVRRYFAMALPLHEEDEERSLAPRLLASAAAAEIEDAIGDMTAQHRALHAILDQLEPAWRRAAEDPASLAAIASVLKSGAEELSRAFDTHLALEERRIFPAMERALSLAERQTIVSEMRQRRAPR